MLAVLPAIALAQRSTDAQPTDEQVNSDKLSRLEALLDAQQRKIDSLQQQVAAASGRDLAQDQAEVMRRQIREILSEQEFRESLMPSVAMAGYDDGFYIRSSDDKFLMRVNGHMQMRWTHYATRSDNRYLLPGRERDDRTGFDMQRMRIGIGGHVHDKDLTYQLEMRADAPDRYDFRVHYAWVNYRFADEFQFKAGVFRLASTRAQVLSEVNFQFMDSPLSDVVFGLGIGTGARIWGKLFKNKVEYFLDVVNSLNGPDNRTITPDPAEHDNNPAILFRAVWHALSDDPDKDFASNADIPIHRDPVLDFGFHYAFNEDAGDQQTSRHPFTRLGLGPGGFGLTTTNGLQIHQFGFDSIFKYCGFSTTAEYYFRLSDVRRAGRTPFTPYWLLTGDSTDSVYHGAYVQSGYFLPIPGLEEKLEVIARIGGVCGIDPQDEGTWEYAAGVNYWFNPKVKLQADVTKVSEVPASSSYASMANVNDDALIFRVQLQVAF